MLPQREGKSGQNSNEKGERIDVQQNLCRY